MKSEILIIQKLKELQDEVTKLSQTYLSKEKLEQIAKYVQQILENKGYLDADAINVLFEDIKQDIVTKAKPTKGIEYRDGVDGIDGVDGVDGKDAAVKYEKVFNKIEDCISEYSKTVDKNLLKYKNDIDVLLNKKVAPESLVEALEAMSGEDRLDISAIRGIENLEVGIQNRAIEILDRRTQFLINKNTQTGGGVWGGITGLLSDQTDLQNALNAKANVSDITKTPNAVAFYGANGKLSEDPTKLNYDDVNDVLMVGTNVNSGADSAPLVIKNKSTLNTFFNFFDNFNIKILEFRASFQDIGIGLDALKNSTLNNRYNIAIGNSALFSSTTGRYNIAIGNSALSSNLTGQRSIAIGSSCLSNSTGAGNQAVGAFSGLSITTGNQNSLYGSGAGGSLTTGSRNVAFGNLTNFRSIIHSENVNIGFQNGSEGQGNNNTSVGANSGCIFGDNNVLIGDKAGPGLPGFSSTGYGDNNIYIGKNSGNNSSYLPSHIENNNIYIGAFTNPPALNLSNFLNIKNLLYAKNASSLLSTVPLGNMGIAVINPTARLHLPAGTAVAENAPLKFTTGTLLTTPENGALEFDGNHYYGTIGSTRYQLDQQGGGATTKKYARFISSTVLDLTSLTSGQNITANFNQKDMETPSSGIINNSGEIFLPDNTKYYKVKAWLSGNGSDSFVKFKLQGNGVFAAQEGAVRSRNAVVAGAISEEANNVALGIMQGGVNLKLLFVSATASSPANSMLISFNTPYIEITEL